MDTETRPKSCAFLDLPAVKKLAELAETPFDLTEEGVLTPKRIDQFVAEACGYKLLYGTERITKETIDALWQLAKEASVFKRMQEMQEGAVMNQIIGFESDHRSVLHTAMRSIFDDEPSSELAKEASEFAQQEHEKLKKFLKKVDDEGKFKNLVLIGIGGSNLGPQALYISLEHLQISGRKVLFISNVDPDDAADALEGLNLSETLVGVISKSGSTMETLTNEALVRSRFAHAGLESKKHFLSVTGKGSPMDNPEKYLECFHAMDYVGGRFCATAIYGGLPLAFGLGYDTYFSLLKGAHEMDLAALSTSKKENLPLLLALLGIWNHNFMGYPTSSIIPYSHALRRFSAHIQQVDMESNGKHIDRYGNRVNFQTGPIIWGEPGTNAQHSFFQFIHQGTAIVPMEFIGFKKTQRDFDLDTEGTSSQEKLNANMIAQAIALAQGKPNDNPNKGFEGNRPSSMLIADRLTPYAMGALFALYEHKIAFQGFIWDINSFDQEGVQLGKVLANEVIKSQVAKKEGKEGVFPLADAIWAHLDSLS